LNIFTIRDLDILVIEPGPIARRLESARLRAALGDIGVPADIVVITEQTFQEWLGTPGMITLEPAIANRPYPVARFGLRIWKLLAQRGTATT
jgi:hypothetical protein